MTLKRVLKWMAVLGAFLLAAPMNAAEPPTLTTQKEKVSYGIGVDMARNFKLQGIEFDPEILIKGFMDQFTGGKLLMTEDDIRATLNAYQSDLLQKTGASYESRREENKKIGDAFLEENKKKEGVVALPSGLQYKILKAGDGRTPTDADMIECNYRGVLINGTEFDSSYRTGKPATLKVMGLIPGWTEALKRMPVGSKWQLFIPPQLAYGERGRAVISGRMRRLFSNWN